MAPPSGNVSRPGRALAALAVLIGYLKFRGISGLRRTRQTVQEDLTLLKRDDGVPASPTSGTG